MRRILFTVLGLLELAVAAVLIVFSCQLPTTEDVHHGFGELKDVTDNTSQQVALLRGEVHDLRRPEVHDTAVRLQTHVRTLTDTLKAQKPDFETVKAMSDALGEAARGLDGLAASLDQDSVARLGDGLLSTAAFLDEKVAPAAGRAADQLDASAGQLAEDARQLAALLRESPLDLKAVAEIHDGLARFSDGLDKMSEALKLQRYDTMREGIKGLETSLNTGAAQVERLSGYTYPVVTLQGYKPVVNQQPFWPDGDTIAKGMRKAAEGVAAAGTEMDGLAKELPKLRESLSESKKVADRSREALAQALKQREKVEPLLKSVPGHAAALAEGLPKLSEDLSKVLRETQKLKDVAAQMRQAHKGLQTAIENWPQIRSNLSGTASMLRTTQAQLKVVVERRADYEKVMKDTIELTDEFAQHLPEYTEHLDQQLAQHEESFDGLGKSIDKVSQGLPAYADTAGRMVQATRLLLWLVAAIVALHAGYLMVSVRLGKQFSP